MIRSRCLIEHTDFSGLSSNSPSLTDNEAERRVHPPLRSLFQSSHP